MLLQPFKRFILSASALIAIIIIPQIFVSDLYSQPISQVFSPIVLSGCWPTDTPGGSLPGQPGPVFCTLSSSGPGTAVEEANAWQDDFDHSLNFAAFGNDYKVFDQLGNIYNSVHWRHANHWMVDIAPESPENQSNNQGLGGAMMRPDRSFHFEDDKLIIESDIAAGHQDYAGLAAWSEFLVTTAAEPTLYRVGGSLYGYDLFPGAWTLGCRLQADRQTICSLMDNTERGLLEGGRVWEMSFFQQVGETTYGGHELVGDGLYWRTCENDDPDIACRDRFRLELTPTSLTIYVNGLLYFEQTGIPPLPEELVNGAIYVYMASMTSSSEFDTVRYHWDNLTINTDQPPSHSPSFEPPTP